MSLPHHVAPPHHSLLPLADESAASSAPSSPEPPLDDDGDFFPLQSNESQSSLGAASSRSSSASPRRQMPKSPIERLPAELLISIFQKLSSTHDLYNCLRVNKRWANNCVDLLWHRPLFTSWDRLKTVAQAISEDAAYWQYHDLIKRLNLSTLASQINDGTVQPFQICRRIERLTLTECKKLTDAGVMSLVQGNRHLLALDITKIDSVTDTSILALAENCPRLQGLNISGCTHVSDASLVPLAENCKYLKRLKLYNCSAVTDASINAFAQRCLSMLEIDLHGCELVTDSSVAALLQGCKQLRELRLAACYRVTNNAFTQLPFTLKLDSLRTLDLTACTEITDAAIERIIDHAPRIRILNLAKCTQITDRSVYAISKLGKNLHDIWLGRCTHITDDALKDLITKCNRIRYIDLAGCVNITDSSVKMLANLPKLRRIGLVKCQSITDASIRALARGTGANGLIKDPRDPRSPVSSSLERVHLSYCLNITITGINELLRKCPKLTHLSLTGIQAFFSRDDLVAYCREAPDEFNEEQRVVFCVFSGDGVSKLRDHLANDPQANPPEYPHRDEEEEDTGDGDAMYGVGPNGGAGTQADPNATPPHGTQESQDGRFSTFPIYPQHFYYFPSRLMDPWPINGIMPSSPWNYRVCYPLPRYGPNGMNSVSQLQLPAPCLEGKFFLNYPYPWPPVPHEYPFSANAMLSGENASYGLYPGGNLGAATFYSSNPIYGVPVLVSGPEGIFIRGKLPQDMRTSPSIPALPASILNSSTRFSATGHWFDPFIGPESKPNDPPMRFAARRKWRGKDAAESALEHCLLATEFARYRGQELHRDSSLEAWIPVRNAFSRGLISPEALYRKCLVSEYEKGAKRSYEVTGAK